MAKHSIPQQHPLLEQVVSTGFLELVRGGLVVAGLSGGADSVAMVLALKSLGCQLVAAHCNFGLRGEESERDEAFVEQFCKEQGFPLKTMRFNTQEEALRHGWSIEMAARELRYGWFESLRKEYDAVCIAVAHHRDDSNETLLLNLMRGTGLRGLCGMPLQNNRYVLRPLIKSSRADVLDFLKARGAYFVEDSSNADTRIKRNKIRHEVLPLLRSINPAIDKSLQQTADHLREYYHFAENHLQQIINEHETISRGIHRLPLKWLKEEPHRHLLVRHWLEGKFPSNVVDEIAKLDGRVGVLYKSSTHVCTLSADYIEHCSTFNPLAKTYLPNSGTMELEGIGILSITTTTDCSVDKANTLCATLDTRSIVGRLWVRSALDGDRFTPYGMNGSKLVSDYLTDKKLSRLEKLKTLVVGDDCGILWLVGHRIDNRGAVSANTGETLFLQLLLD